MTERQMLLQRDRYHGTPSCSRAFTIMELIVAIGISAILIFFVGRLFSDVGDAVLLGVNKTEIAANSNTIADAIQSDAAAMVGPVGNGILIIVNHQIAATVRSQTTAGGEISKSVRSDQLVFFRNVSTVPTDPNRMEPLVASGSHSYSNSATGASFARVWYGHLRRTHPNGSDTPVITAAPMVGDLGSRGTAGSDLNFWANEWILGRQILYLNPSVAAFTTHAAAPPNANYWQAVLFDASVVNGFVPDIPAYVPSRLYMGLADVAKVALQGSGAPAEADAIIGTDPMDTNYLVFNGQNDMAYKAAALSLTYNVERLRVNPGMEPGLTSRFHPWRVAQMYPYLMSNVSDVIFDFAADIYSPTGVDKTPLSASPQVPIGFEGTIKWYTSSAFANYPGGPNGYDSRMPLTFDVPVAYESYLNVPFGAYVTRAFVWRHDADPPVPPAGTAAWPHLIRIRYRLHDDRGVLGESAQTSATTADPGIWFEQIIAVNRN